MGRGAGRGSLRLVGRVRGARGGYWGGRALGGGSSGCVVGRGSLGLVERVLGGGSLGRGRDGGPWSFGGGSWEAWGGGGGRSSGRGAGRGSLGLVGRVLGARGGDRGRVLGAVRAASPAPPARGPWSPEARGQPSSGRRTRSGGAAERARAGLGRGRGGGRRPQRPPAAPGARSQGEDEAERGRNHEPEFPQVSDPALLRLQRGGSQEQGKPGPAVCAPLRMNERLAGLGDWALREVRELATTLERGRCRGMRGGPAALPAPARTQSPAARWVPLEPGARRAARAPNPRGSGSFVPRAGDDPARSTVEGRCFRGDPGAARSGAVGEPGGPARGEGRAAPPPSRRRRLGTSEGRAAAGRGPQPRRRSPGPGSPGAPGRWPLPLPAPRPERAPTCGWMCAFG